MMSGKLVRIVLMSFYIAVMTALSVRFSQIEASAGPVYESPPADDVSYSAPWFSLTDDMTELTVTLRSTRLGYQWKYGISRDGILQLADRTGTDGECRMRFKVIPDTEADIRLVFSYMKTMDHPVESQKTVDLRITKDGRIEVLDYE